MRRLSLLVGGDSGGEVGSGLGWISSWSWASIDAIVQHASHSDCTPRTGGSIYDLRILNTTVQLASPDIHGAIEDAQLRRSTTAAPWFY